MQIVKSQIKFLSNALESEVIEEKNTEIESILNELQPLVSVEEFKKILDRTEDDYQEALYKNRFWPMRQIPAKNDVIFKLKRTVEYYNK